MKIPCSTVDIRYLQKVLKNEYSSNKNYKNQRDNIINEFKELSTINAPILVNILIQRYLLLSKTERKNLLSYFMRYKNLKISYINNDNKGIFSTSIY